MFIYNIYRSSVVRAFCHQDTFFFELSNKKSLLFFGITLALHLSNLLDSANMTDKYNDRSTARYASDDGYHYDGRRSTGVADLREQGYSTRMENRRRLPRPPSHFRPHQQYRDDYGVYNDAYSDDLEDSGGTFVGAVDHGDDGEQQQQQRRGMSTAAASTTSSHDTNNNNTTGGVRPSKTSTRNALRSAMESKHGYAYSSSNMGDPPSPRPLMRAPAKHTTTSEPSRTINTTARHRFSSSLNDTQQQDRYHPSISCNNYSRTTTSSCLSRHEGIHDRTCDIHHPPSRLMPPLRAGVIDSGVDGFTDGHNSGRTNIAAATTTDPLSFHRHNISPPPPGATPHPHHHDESAAISQSLGTKMLRKEAPPMAPRRNHYLHHHHRDHQQRSPVIIDDHHGQQSHHRNDPSPRQHRTSAAYDEDDARSTSAMSIHATRAPSITTDHHYSQAVAPSVASRCKSPPLSLCDGIVSNSNRCRHHHLKQEDNESPFLPKDSPLRYFPEYDREGRLRPEILQRMQHPIADPIPNPPSTNEAENTLDRRNDDDDDEHLDGGGSRRSNVGGHKKDAHEQTNRDDMRPDTLAIHGDAIRRDEQHWMQQQQQHKKMVIALQQQVQTLNQILHDAIRRIDDEMSHMNDRITDMFKMAQDGIEEVQESCVQFYGDILPNEDGYLELYTQLPFETPEGHHDAVVAKDVARSGITTSHVHNNNNTSIGHNRDVSSNSGTLLDGTASTIRRGGATIPTSRMHRPVRNSDDGASIARYTVYHVDCGNTLRLSYPSVVCRDAHGRMMRWLRTYILDPVDCRLEKLWVPVLNRDTCTRLVGHFRFEKTVYTTLIEVNDVVSAETLSTSSTMHRDAKKDGLSDRRPCAPNNDMSPMSPPTCITAAASRPVRQQHFVQQRHHKDVTGENNNAMMLSNNDGAQNETSTTTTTAPVVATLHQRSSNISVTHEKGTEESCMDMNDPLRGDNQSVDNTTQPIRTTATHRSTSNTHGMTISASNNDVPTSNRRHSNASSSAGSSSPSMTCNVPIVRNPSKATHHLSQSTAKSIPSSSSIPSSLLPNDDNGESSQRVSRVKPSLSTTIPSRSSKDHHGNNMTCRSNTIATNDMSAIASSDALLSSVIMASPNGEKEEGDNSPVKIDHHRHRIKKQQQEDVTSQGDNYESQGEDASSAIVDDGNLDYLNDDNAARALIWQAEQTGHVALNGVGSDGAPLPSYTVDASSSDVEDVHDVHES